MVEGTQALSQLDIQASVLYGPVHHATGRSLMTRWHERFILWTALARGTQRDLCLICLLITYFALDIFDDDDDRSRESEKSVKFDIYFTQKLPFCHHLLTLKFLQNMYEFNTNIKEDIFEKWLIVFIARTMEVNGDQNCLGTNIVQNILFYVQKNNMRVSKRLSSS